MRLSLRLSVALSSLFFLLLAALVSPSSVGAQAVTPFLNGYGWSSTAGWVGFGTTTSNPNGVKLIPPLSNTADVNTGVFQGYAWSSNLGWIKFDPTLVGPNGLGGATIAASNRVVGWGRACSVFVTGCNGSLLPDSARGGWDGWISFGTPNSTYGVTYNPLQKKLGGKAWGQLNMSWLDMSGVGIGNSTVVPTTPVFSCVASPSSVRTGDQVTWTVSATDDLDNSKYIYNNWAFTATDGGSAGLAASPFYPNVTIKSSAITSYTTAGQKTATVNAYNRLTGALAQSDIQCSTVPNNSGGGGRNCRDTNSCVVVNPPQSCQVKVHYVGTAGIDYQTTDYVTGGGLTFVPEATVNVPCTDFSVTTPVKPITWSGACLAANSKSCGPVNLQGGVVNTITADFRTNQGGLTIGGLSLSLSSLGITNPVNYPICTRTKVTLTALNPFGVGTYKFALDPNNTRSGVLLSGGDLYANFYTTGGTTLVGSGTSITRSTDKVDVTICLRNRNTDQATGNSKYSGQWNIPLGVQGCSADGVSCTNWVTNTLRFSLQDNSR